MKRYVILLAAVLCVSSASAWNKLAQESIATLAEQNLTPKAKEQCAQILGGSLASGAWWLQTITKDEQTKFINEDFSSEYTYSAISSSTVDDSREIRIKITETV